MALRISLSGGFTSQVSADLRELGEKLEEHGVTVSLNTVSVQGAKMDLAVGLAIASLAVSSISTLINVINFWKGQKKSSYRLKLEGDEAANEDSEVTDEVLKTALQSGRPVTLLVEKL
ncbi:hypothetical protein B0G80_7373 [Paraburkholderia sp. BL6669N2]|uniref:hypothetical protein n=1 Tax=Paraburkholderia sp. BL6669N2 TaxID=1938807 RepID=UPI000E391B9B|nr:hypothetical protein [Paraburkholderia sp. BL6669N2]REG50902.1 hypothetical protein B0G80_7373 [Paraburkholderia sp. BL6669N2]